MPRYKHDQFFTKESGAGFDAENALGPAKTTPYSGIYRCTGCGDEIAANAGNPLPPQNHHQHPDRSGVKWQLVARAMQV